MNLEQAYQNPESVTDADLRRLDYAISYAEIPGIYFGEKFYSARQQLLDRIAALKPAPKQFTPSAAALRDFAECDRADREA